MAVEVRIDAGAAPPTEAAAAPLVLEHPHTSTGLDNRKLLMWAFLASDCMFFGTLLATYLVYKNRSLDGPLPRGTFDVPYTSVSASFSCEQPDDGARARCDPARRRMPHAHLAQRDCLVGLSIPGGPVLRVHYLRYSRRLDAG